MKRMIFLLILSTFTFQTAGGESDGFLEMPSTPPKALVLYFHRYVEKRDAVTLWGEFLTPRGYAVAGFTAEPGRPVMEMANQALLSLRRKPELQKVPVIAMGASMGSLSAAQWFAANSDVRALILIVPGSPTICSYLKSAGGRPAFLIQADQDEVTHGSGSKVQECVPAANRFLLKGAGHIFPPAAVSGEIIRWIDSLKFQ
jgi:hypothetical protein